MRALTFYGKQTVRHKSVPDPVIQEPTDALLRVQLSAICGSDLHVYHGREKGLDPGTVMGHEYAGEIVEAGRQVRNFRTGDRVFGPFTTSCGRCFYCRKGLTSRCQHGQLFGWVENGLGLQGTQAEVLRVPLADSTLVSLPDGVPADLGLLLGDVLATAYFCADMAEVEPEGFYVVLGCGPVGLMAVVALQELGAERIVAIDAVRERLGLANRLGAASIGFQKENPIDIVKEATEGRGADAVLEVVGSPAATRMAVDLVRPGGIVSAVGVHTEQQFAFSPVEAYDKNLTYRAGRCPARSYMERLLPLAQRRKNDLLSIITHRLPLSEGVRGYEIFDKKLEGCIKVVLAP